MRRLSCSMPLRRRRRPAREPIRARSRSPCRGTTVGDAARQIDPLAACIERVARRLERQRQRRQRVGPQHAVERAPRRDSAAPRRERSRDFALERALPLQVREVERIAAEPGLRRRAPASIPLPCSCVSSVLRIIDVEVGAQRRADRTSRSPPLPRLGLSHQRAVRCERRASCRSRPAPPCARRRCRRDAAPTE